MTGTLLLCGGGSWLDVEQTLSFSLLFPPSLPPLYLPLYISAFHPQPPAPLPPSLLSSPPSLVHSEPVDNFTLTSSCYLVSRNASCTALPAFPVLSDETLSSHTHTVAKLPVLYQNESGAEVFLTLCFGCC